jgi:hypothetical protein
MLLCSSESVLFELLVIESGVEKFCFIHFAKIMPQAGQVPVFAVSVSLLLYEHLGQVVYTVKIQPRAMPQFQQSVNWPSIFSPHLHTHEVLYSVDSFNKSLTILLARE